MAAPRALLLDGGMGHLLRRMGVPIQGRVGSAERFLGVAMANVTQPALVTAAHLAYIDAGADIITTNNYAAVPRCLELASETSDLAELLRRVVEGAGEAARKAVDRRQQPQARAVRVAGCLPPLADSYRADLVGDFDDNVAAYARIAASISPYSDLLLCETMSSAQEAAAAATAAASTGLPVWVSWTLDEHAPQLRSGESIDEALVALQGLEVQGFLFNCTSPETISQALPQLRRSARLPPEALVGGYANGFVTAQSGSGEYRKLDPDAYWGQFVRQWLDGGEGGGGGGDTVVGGCCGIFPEHIARIREGIDSSGGAEEVEEVVQKV